MKKICYSFSDKTVAGKIKRLYCLILYEKFTLPVENNKNSIAIALKLVVAGHFHRSSVKQLILVYNFLHNFPYGNAC
jgi:hypothetical protein